jgi:homoserine O-succinyltransferase/O-acetyltransferase
MPVRVESSHSGLENEEGTAWTHGELPRADDSSACISIGLINNMPEAAFEATERQFISLLTAASEGIPISLSLYVLSTAKAGERRTGNSYSNFERLDGRRLDGLIVTGREPTTPNLKDELYWQNFTEVVEWARENTCSTVWSCLAAHAAVLYLDGIERQRSRDKRFGVFECARASEHRLMANAGPRFYMPHSRWNGVAEEQLAACGYQVLTRTEEQEVDAFVKEGKSLFVFFQGHPEYEADTLLREYRRDIGRSLQLQSSTYPATPGHYFDAETESMLAYLRERALATHSKEGLAEVAKALEDKRIENTWRSTAVLLYRNWLEYLYESKGLNRCDGATVADGPKPLLIGL